MARLSIVLSTFLHVCLLHVSDNRMVARSKAAGNSRKRLGLMLMAFGALVLLGDVVFVLVNYTLSTGPRNTSIPILGGSLVPVGLMPLIVGFLVYSAIKRPAGPAGKENSA